MIVNIGSRIVMLKMIISAHEFKKNGRKQLFSRRL